MNDFLKTVVFSLTLIYGAAIGTNCLLPSAHAATPVAEDNPANIKLSTEQRQALLQTLQTKIRANYVFPEVAEKIQRGLQERERAGAYAQAGTIGDLAKLLSTDLVALSKDKHFRVSVSREAVPEDLPPGSNPSLTPAELEQRLQRDRWINFGVEKFERLGGNIAYIELLGFNQVDHAAETLVALMNVAASANAVIFDLRRNGGGDPATVALLSSYLFDSEPVHLNDLYYRNLNQTRQYWTNAWVPGKRLGPNKPVYVLTSERTFSAAEEFSYNLKNLKRATLIGATTGGGANPGDDFKLHQHLAVFIPTGRAISPITGTNWEGKGVVPDIAVPPEQALLTAHIHAVQGVMASTSEVWRKPSLERLLKELQGKLAEMKKAPPAPKL